MCFLHLVHPVAAHCGRQKKKRKHELTQAHTWSIHTHKQPFSCESRSQVINGESALIELEQRAQQQQNTFQHSAESYSTQFVLTITPLLDVTIFMWLKMYCKSAGVCISC